MFCICLLLDSCGWFCSPMSYISHSDWETIRLHKPYVYVYFWILVVGFVVQGRAYFTHMGDRQTTHAICICLLLDSGGWFCSPRSCISYSYGRPSDYTRYMYMSTSGFWRLVLLSEVVPLLTAIWGPFLSPRPILTRPTVVPLALGCGGT